MAARAAVAAEPTLWSSLPVVHCTCLHLRGAMRRYELATTSVHAPAHLYASGDQRDSGNVRQPSLLAECVAGCWLVLLRIL